MARQLTAYPLREPEGDDTTGSGPTAGPDTVRVWNWARNSTLASPGSVASPRTEDEVRAVLSGARGRVRVVGSRMSAGRMLEVGGPDDVLLDVTGLTGLLALDEETATFAGGTRLQEVYDVLSPLGRVLPSSPGVIASQTLAGALATGTHGQGLGQGSIGDSVLALRMVLADGSVTELDGDHPWFGAAVLGLGALGVVTAVVLRTEPSRVYTCAKGATSAATLEDDLLEWNRSSALSKAWWFPDEDQVHVWTAQEATDEEVAEYRAGGSALVERTETSDAMNRTVDATLAQMRSDTRILDEDGKPFRTVTRFKDFSDVTGDVYQVFMRGIATPQINVEIGVPLEHAPAVVQKIRAWHAETRPHLHYPIILRCTGPSSSWLSPAHDRETCFFGFVVYYSADGSLSPEGVAFLRAVEEVLAAEGGRPHWGKYFEETLYDWPSLYPRWDDFQAVRAALDPGRVFANAFTEELFDR